MSQTNFVRIPPDSTGKKIRNRKLLDIRVSSLDTDVIGTILRGETITGTTSNATGIFTGFDVDAEGSFIYLTQIVGIFQVGETLNNGLATIDSISEIFTPEISLIDGNEPRHRLKIDDRGSMSTKFAQGDPGFDAFGNLQISESSIMDSHMFQYTDNPNKYIDIPLNGGSLTYSSTASSIILQTDTTATSFIKRRSNVLYPYQPAVGNQLIASVAVGDTGKANVIRRWGLGTPENAIFFEVNGTTVNVVVRTSVTGTTVETRTPRTEWIGDRLDNDAISSYVLNIANFNLYWIDYQWLGVGKIRFGTYAPDGTRIVVHQVENANKSVLPWSQTGTFPLFFEQFNTGVPASSSEMKVACAVIVRQNSTVEFTGEQYKFVTPSLKTFTDTPTHLFSAKFKETVGGRPNYIGILPTILDNLVVDQPCIVELWINPTLGTPAFDYEPHPNSAIDIDFGTGSVTTVGEAYRTILMDTGFNRFEPDQSNVSNMVFGVPEAPGLTVTWTVRSVVPATSGSILSLLEYKEIR